MLRFPLIRSALLPLLGLLLMAPAAHARRPGHGGRGDGLMNPQAIERVAQRLGLEEAVVARLKDKLFAAKARSIELKAELETARLSLKRELDQAEPDRAAAMKAIEEVGRLRTELRKLKTGALLDVRAELTPAQREQLKAMRSEFRERRRGKRHRGGAPDAPPPPDAPSPPDADDLDD
ncbi:MAG: periplasmic heavy metal sensor [Myxococcales bacterium]|nr:periplasmic heavy metal sensor [Myxococcales bacterium]